ncbi:MAG: histidinol-phosphate transaminase [Dehalococcoidia bacterium]|nr:histidinol-phosphate transaminase [Dehalococcoidia bacterium]
MIERGLNPDNMRDFSISCNPFGLPENIRASLNELPAELYPDSDSYDLVEALSGKLCVSTGNIIVCNGSTELIRLAIIAYLSRQDKSLILQPTYGDYELACRQFNTGVVYYQLNEDNNFLINVDALIKSAELHRPKAMFICNPNNPTGQYLPIEKVQRIASIFNQTLIILDEAYIAFTRNSDNALKLIDMPNVLLCRSMTKDFALAGLRLGYGLASSEIINNLKKSRPPWNVNSAAQQAGIAALMCDEYLAESTAGIFEAKQYLVDELSAMGLNVIPSQTNYFLVKVGNAAKFRETLLREGFAVRDCTSFGLRQYVRIAPRAIEDCRELIKAIKKIRTMPACKHDS